MKRNIVALFGACVVLMTSCDLDYTNNGTINPDNVWSDKNMISSFLTDIYGNMLPGWPVSANNTDEGMNGPTNMSQFARGQITIDNYTTNWGYGNIDRINFFLDQLEGVTVLTDVEKKQMRGQALFWRAWDYFDKVNTVGGVPLILEVQNIADVPSLFVSRNSTSECITQILKDLDDAISYLPDSYDDKGYGRIDKGAAMAFKGRVLMFYASPMFNPNNDASRWETAYKANKTALDYLTAQGKGLYKGNFADIWYDEQNCEAIMVNQFYYPDHAFDQKNIRPEPLTRDGANDNQAILSLLMAFPKLDGTPLTLDLNRLATDEAYNLQFLTDFYTNRDPRFHATIFCPGTIYPCTNVQLEGGQKYWNAWYEQEVDGKTQMNSLVDFQTGTSIGGGMSGYFQKKGLDESLNNASVYQAETDWIEIRFAEVLMNYGECANEIGKTQEALNVLYQIRERAGIENTTGNYGITATTQSDIREAYVNERFVEFAYEGKRWNDLRRWKRFDILNNLKHRSTLYAVINDKADAEGFDFTKDMFDPEVRKMFHFVYIENVDKDDLYTFNLDEKYLFYPIHKEALDRNSKLEQNDAWGGTFDPLK